MKVYHFQKTCHGMDKKIISARDLWSYPTCLTIFYKSLLNFFKMKSLRKNDAKLCSLPFFLQNTLKLEKLHVHAFKRRKCVKLNEFGSKFWKWMIVKFLHSVCTWVWNVNVCQKFSEVPSTIGQEKKQLFYCIIFVNL